MRQLQLSPPAIQANLVQCGGSDGGGVIFCDLTETKFCSSCLARSSTAQMQQATKWHETVCSFIKSLKKSEIILSPLLVPSLSSFQICLNLLSSQKFRPSHWSESNDEEEGASTTPASAEDCKVSILCGNVQSANMCWQVPLANLTQQTAKKTLAIRHWTVGGRWHLRFLGGKSTKKHC